MKPYQKLLLFMIPMYIAADFYLLSYAFELLSQANDIAVAVGAVLICILLAANYFYIQYLLTFKTNKKDENKA